MLDIKVNSPTNGNFVYNSIYPFVRKYINRVRAEDLLNMQINKINKNISNSSIENVKNNCENYEDDEKCKEFNTLYQKVIDKIDKINDEANKTIIEENIEKDLNKLSSDTSNLIKLLQEAEKAPERRVEERRVEENKYNSDETNVNIGFIDISTDIQRLMNNFENKTDGISGIRNKIEEYKKKIKNFKFKSTDPTNIAKIKIRHEENINNLNDQLNILIKSKEQTDKLNEKKVTSVSTPEKKLTSVKTSVKTPVKTQSKIPVETQSKTPVKTTEKTSVKPQSKNILAEKRHAFHIAVKNAKERVEAERVEAERVEAEKKEEEAILKKIIDKTPQNITREEWSTFFEEDVEPIKNTIKDIIKIKDINEINKIIEKNEQKGFSEDYQNNEAKYYSHVIFFILGFLTPLLEKKGVTVYLKGGQAIHLNTQPSTYPEYPSNDIDIDFIIKDDSSFKKRDVCHIIRNFIYWCVSDDDNIGDTNSDRFGSFVSKNKFLSSIDSINVVKISYSYNGQMFALMDMSFKDGLPDIKKLFTPNYIQHKNFEINGITHKYNYQSVLSMILEKIFILINAGNEMIAIKDKSVIFNKFIATLQYTLQLYIITHTENTTEQISTEYSKLFNVDEKAIQEFINDVLYPGKREQEREQNRELETLLEKLVSDIKTFKENHENLFNNLSHNCSLNNVNATISLTEMYETPTLEDKKKYILNKLRINVVENINKYLKNKKCSNYLERNNINLKKVRDEWNEITNINKYKSLSRGIPSNSFQGMSPLREPTYEYLYRNPYQ